MTHPLEEMAQALIARADRIDDNIMSRSYVTVDVAESAEAVSIEARLTARILRSLHPDVARCALALAEGLRVPEGWTVEMDDAGGIAVTKDWISGASVNAEDDRWRVELWDCGQGFAREDTPQAAVDAAVRALGGTP